MEVRKSVQIAGNLLKDELIYKPYPVEEFRDANKFKQISILNVAYNVNENIDHTIATMTCNFVKHYKFNAASEVISYQAPLMCFIIDKKYEIKSPTPTWHPINSVSEELRLSIADLENKVIKKNIDLYLTVLFR